MGVEQKSVTACFLGAIAISGRAGDWAILGGKGPAEFGIRVSIAEGIRAIFYDEDQMSQVSSINVTIYLWFIPHHPMTVHYFSRPFATSIAPPSETVVIISLEVFQYGCHII